MTAIVEAVAASPSHTMGKASRRSVRLAAGLGIEGDAHAGVTVQHRSRVRRDPAAPNLRQVHLLHAELLDALISAGFPVHPGSIGENITTRGLDLLGLSRHARLHLGDTAVVEVTGLRNPCAQLDGIAPGLMQSVLDRAGDGSVVRRAGIMGVVRSGGDVRPGDPIAVELPAGPHLPLEPV